MKRIFVVDDEKPVVDLIARIVQTELSTEYTVADTASSGREALEKMPIVNPDIVLMDVKMPGLSGLDTIRELKRRGSNAAFLLSTAYERFDIAREALELGIVGYLLKPVARDKLAQALKSASEMHDRLTEVERREFGLKEKDSQVRSFVVAAFLGQLMLGESGTELLSALMSWLEIHSPWGIVVAARFTRNELETHRVFEDAVQYKTQGICGPLITGRCAVFLPLSDASKAEEEKRRLTAALESTLSEEMRRDTVRFAFSEPCECKNLAPAWAQALRRLSGQNSQMSDSEAADFGAYFLQQEEEFVTALTAGDPHRVRTTLESILEGVEKEASVPLSVRYRMISLLGYSVGRLVRQGVFDENEARSAFDFDDLRNASDGTEFGLLVRSRLPALTGAVNRARLWSPTVAAALEYMRQNYGQPITLDSVADRLGVTPKKLSRLFIEEIGQGFSDHLIDIRIERAKLLLSLPGASIKQVSSECGYPDPNYFSRLFKKVTGVPPSAFSHQS